MAESKPRAASRRADNQAMAAQLKKMGYPHGRRFHTSLADPMQYLRPDLVGTARYRRLKNK